MKGRAVGIGPKGERLPHTPEQVREIVDAALKDGDVLAALMKTADGQVAIAVFGPPSREMLSILETSATAYRRSLRELGDDVPFIDVSIAQKLLGMDDVPFRAAYLNNAAFHAACHVIAHLWMEGKRDD